MAEEEEEEEEEESFEAFHVPQQSRRDKLRVTTTLLNPLNPNPNPNPNNTTANHHHHHQVHVDEEEEEEGDISGGTLGHQHHFHQHHHHGVGVGRGGVVLHDPSSLLLTTTYTNTSNPLPILGSGSGSITIGGGPDKHRHPHLDVVMSSVKEEGSAAGNGNLMMNYVNGLFMNNSTATTTASHHHHHPLFTSPNNIHQQPTPTRRVSNPFDLYNLNNFTDFNGGAGAADVVAFRPQPLSFITNNHNDTSRTTITGQGNLSLSLSSTTTTTYDLPYTTSLPLSLPPPLQLNTTIDHPYGTLGGGVIIIDDTNTGGDASASTSASTSRDARSLVPLGPFTGYASILKGSKFLKPAKQLLDEFCYVGMGKGIGSIVTPPNSSMDPPLDTINGSSFVDDSSLSCTGPGLGGDSRLISMLDEVYRRYKLYYQQMQAVVASFESVAGLGNAAPYTSFALKAMSKHFSYLKNAITDQLHSNKALDDGIHGKNEAQRVGTDDQWVHGHRPDHNVSYFEHQHQHQPVWRPQRGLPERAVAVLRAWLFEHFLHPYPTDTDKQMLAKQTGLSRSQVSNWFINARVRLWKPMVEEIHMLETCQAHKTSDVENRNLCNPPPTSNPPNYDRQPQTSSVNVQDQTLKRTRDELHDSIPEQASEPTNFMYNKFLNHRHIGAGVSTSGGNSGVSLTLGLCQNNGIGLSESFPMNIAHQFGLEASNDGYVIGSFEAPPRHFGRDMGGQLFHDFVG